MTNSEKNKLKQKKKKKKTLSKPAYIQSVILQSFISYLFLHYTIAYLFILLVQFVLVVVKALKKIRFFFAQLLRTMQFRITILNGAVAVFIKNQTETETAQTQSAPLEIHKCIHGLEIG